MCKFFNNFIKIGMPAFSIFFMLTLHVQGQVLVGGSGVVNAGAMMELRSGNRGFLPPRINLTSNVMKLNNTVPADGMVIYSTNDSIGRGLFVFRNSMWNKLVQKSASSITYAQLKGTGLDDQKNRIKWDTVYTKQPIGAAKLWSSGAPTDIVIRSTGIYLISASFRIENTGSQHYMNIWANSFKLSEKSYRTTGAQNKSMSMTIMAWLKENDIITVAGTADGKAIALGLGTTQLSITQIPSNSY